MKIKVCLVLQTSDAEAGRNTSNTLSEGASYKDVQDYRSAAINAGAWSKS